MHAQIHDTRVCQVEPEPFEVAEPLHWVECPNDVTPLHSYVDGVFVAPEPVPVAPPAPPPPTDTELAAGRAALDALVANGLISAEARAQMSPPPA